MERTRAGACSTAWRRAGGGGVAERRESRTQEWGCEGTVGASRAVPEVQTLTGVLYCTPEPGASRPRVCGGSASTLAVQVHAGKLTGASCSGALTIRRWQPAGKTAAPRPPHSGA